MRFDKLCDSILERVFHGTPHDIVGTFDLQKIGSGEGNQVYGWGLYFAENPEVAQEYRKVLSRTHLIDKIREVYDELDSSDDAIEALKDAGLSKKEINLIQALQNDDFLGFDYPHQAVNAALKEPQNFDLSDDTKMAIASMGNLYEVNILADKENDFLDWDKPFSEQSEKVKSLITKIADQLKDKEFRKNANKTQAILARKSYEVVENSGLVGDEDFQEQPMSVFYNDIAQELNKQLNTDEGDNVYTLPKNTKATSEALLAAGILGIRYLDQGSRGTGEGTYNYVIFDPKITQIVAQNGEFVMTSKTPENVEV